MAKQLVIVESPAKAKTIGKILGPDYLVKSSVGHIRDLPERMLGVDIEHGFKPEYVIAKNKKKLVEELRKAAKECPTIYLAPDPDREGEAIAWHLREVLQKAAPKAEFKRVQYNEITEHAVRNAFAHPGEIDIDRVNAQQARRVLDRIVGYQVSPMLWRKVRRGASAGRVQSVALRLVCEREREILQFKPEAYWVMGVKVAKGNESFTARLARIDGQAKVTISDETAAQAHLSQLEGRALVVKDLQTKDILRRAVPPFITSTLQQAASSFCGFSPSRTMSLAQHLYEGVEINGAPVGLITYMRTDSVNLSQEARTAAKTFILEHYGTDYYPAKPNFFSSRTNAQEAHEAIRPTDVNLTPEKVRPLLDPPAFKLYDLIWRRFVASQMAPQKLRQHTVEILSTPPPEQAHSYLFSASATEVLFPGFQRVLKADPKKARKPQSDIAEDDDDEDEEPDTLPELVVGDRLQPLEWLTTRKETKPPKRFSEASLIKALESNGVGRPSTYAAIIETLDARKYISRNKRQIAPTDFGFQVNDLLVAKLGNLVNVDFTADMESKLDHVEHGTVPWTEMMAKFYSDFSDWMAHTQDPGADPKRVQVLLELLSGVKEWHEPVKYGRRTLDDHKFVESISRQFAETPDRISDRQLASLIRLAQRYREQLPTAESVLAGLGYQAEEPQSSDAPDTSAAEARFALLDELQLPDETRRFVDSIKAQVAGGRALSPAQARALDRMLLRSVRKLDNGSARLRELGLDVPDEPPQEDPAQAGLQDIIRALDSVKEWAEPFKRGRMTYDDKSFFSSLSRQYAQKAYLSPKQVQVLKRLVVKYREQIADFDQLAAQYGLNPPPAKA